MNLDTLIDQAVDGRPCCNVSHDALWALVDEWEFEYFQVETREHTDALNAMLADDIADVLAGNGSQFGDKYAERVWQAMGWTRPDGRAFFDSDYDAI